MPLSDPARSLLQEIDTLSGRSLRRRDDLGLLIDCALGSGRNEILADLAFRAKFAWKSHSIMQRIGKGADGYEALAREFMSAVEEIRRLLDSLVDGCDGTAGLRDRLLAMTPAALEELLSLIHDLTWYKNWLIDRR
jgi:hypothetical protein